MKVRGWSSFRLSFTKCLTEFELSWRIYDGSTGDNTDKPSESQALETRHFCLTWRLEGRAAQMEEWHQNQAQGSHSENTRLQRWANSLLCPLQPSLAPLQSRSWESVSRSSVNFHHVWKSPKQHQDNCSFWSYKVKDTAQPSPDSNPVLSPSRNT